MADSRDQDLHEANVLEWTVYKRRLYPTFFGAGPPELQLRKIEESCLQHAKALRTKHNADPDPRLVADPWFNNKQNPFVSKAIDEAKQQAHARAAEIDGAIQVALTVVRDEANKVCPVEAQLRAQIVEKNARLSTPSRKPLKCHSKQTMSLQVIAKVPVMKHAEAQKPD